MMGELFLYRGVQPEQIESMWFTKMRYWHKWHDIENDRIDRENRRIKARKQHHPDA